MPEQPKTQFAMSEDRTGNWAKMGTQLEFGLMRPLDIIKYEQWLAIDDATIAGIKKGLGTSEHVYLDYGILDCRQMALSDGRLIPFIHHDAIINLKDDFQTNLQLIYYSGTRVGQLAVTRNIKESTTLDGETVSALLPPDADYRLRPMAVCWGYENHPNPNLVKIKVIGLMIPK